MTDKLTPQQRHLCMSRIRSKDTRPELVVRRWLWSEGYRYRLYVKSLPGKPDIVMGRYRIAIFVNGCFWHGHHVNYTYGHPESLVSSDCCHIPQSNTERWQRKFARNIERDVQNYRALKAAGWTVLVIWECQLRGKEQRDATLKALSAQISGIILDRLGRKTTYVIDDEPNATIAAENDIEYGK